MDFRATEITLFEWDTNAPHPKSHLCHFVFSFFTLTHSSQKKKKKLSDLAGAGGGGIRARCAQLGSSLDPHIPRSPCPKTPPTAYFFPTTYLVKSLMEKSMFYIDSSPKTLISNCHCHQENVRST